MTRDVIPLKIDDLSDFARNLRAGLDRPPSHLEMLGHIARAAGFRNYQHLRAASQPGPKADARLVERALRHFDAEGRLTRFPGRTQVQALCLWALWAQLPARQEMSERAISLRLDTMCRFRDAAQLRRSLAEHGLVTRERDGSRYLRREGPVPPDPRAVIAAVAARLTV